MNITHTRHFYHKISVHVESLSQSIIQYVESSILIGYERLRRPSVQAARRREGEERFGIPENLEYHCYDSEQGLE